MSDERPWHHHWTNPWGILGRPQPAAQPPAAVHHNPPPLFPVGEVHYAGAAHAAGLAAGHAAVHPPHPAPGHPAVHPHAAPGIPRSSFPTVPIPPFAGRPPPESAYTRPENQRRELVLSGVFIPGGI